MEIKIRQSTVLVSACCHSPFMVSNAIEGELCWSCREKWQSISVWYSEDGNMEFVLTSDKREVR